LGAVTAEEEELIERRRFLLFSIGAALVASGPARGVETLIPVEVALGDVSLNKVLFLVAADNGLYARNGLDVEQFITPGAAEVARRSGVDVPGRYVKENIGTAPLEVGGGSPMMYRVATDPNAISRVILATTENHIRFHVIAAPSIHTVDDLKDKRLGFSVPGAVSQVAALSWAKRMGWTPGKDIFLISHANALEPLKEGKVDAVLGAAMLYAMAPQMNLKDIADLEPYNFPVAGSGIMAERGWLKTHRDIAVRFVTASLEAFALMTRDRSVFDASLAKWFNIKDAMTQARMYAEVADMPRKPYPSVEGVEISMALYDSAAMRAHKAQDFYDSSIVAELDRSGFIDGLYR
jgi:ABC-type nitrate/sulfonate/bicarbonate transport system substrate-binding protein